MNARMGGADYYDRAGGGYAERRRSDSRIEAAITAALGDATSLVNVGAGTGSYEPRDRRVVAVEPSLVMIAQRAPGAPVVRAVAEALPFPDGCFDVALAVLTMHHWSNWRRGTAELRRIAARTVVLTFDPDAEPHFWLFDYFPQIRDRDRLRMPPLAELCALLNATAAPLPIPHDCTDGFLGACWRTPASYLDERVRASASAFAMLSGDELTGGLQRLESDLGSGRWQEQYGRLFDRDEADLGYRVVVGG